MSGRLPTLSVVLGATYVCGLGGVHQSGDACDCTPSPASSR
jgi:hypothetical protein